MQNEKVAKLYLLSFVLVLSLSYSFNQIIWLFIHFHIIYLSIYQVYYQVIVLIHQRSYIHHWVIYLLNFCLSSFEYVTLGCLGQLSFRSIARYQNFSFLIIFPSAIYTKIGDNHFPFLRSLNSEIRFYSEAFWRYLSSEVPLQAFPCYVNLQLISVDAIIVYQFTKYFQLCQEVLVSLFCGLPLEMNSRLGCSHAKTHYAAHVLHLHWPSSLLIDQIGVLNPPPSGLFSTKNGSLQLVYMKQQDSFAYSNTRSFN